MADDKTKVLEQATDLVLKIALDLDQQRPAREQCLDSVAIKVLDAHFLEPAGLHDACDASRIVAVVLVDLHLQHRFCMASIDTDYRQVKPRELGPKPSCRRSSLKPNPNRTRRFRPHEPSNRFRDRIDDALSDNRSLLVHYADRRLLQRHVKSNIAFHCASPSLLGPHEADPSIPGELIPYALVWLDPGITPCCKSLLSHPARFGL